MSQFQTALSATTEYLLTLKADGVRYLNLSAETLRELQNPAPARTQAVVQPPVAAPTLALPPAPLPQPVTVPVVPVAAPALDKEGAMAVLREKALACVKCPHLVASRQSVVFGVGNLNAELMFIGEAPGADEDRRGEPFVGAAGQLLTKIIVATGLSREKVYIANILKCRPDTPNQNSGNRKPTPDEMKTCLPWLEQQIDIIRPRVLVALGATAAEGLLGPGGGISRMRGHFKEYRGIPIMPTFHPSYLLHKGDLAEKRKVWEDMMQVMVKLGLAISDKQRGFFLSAPKS